MITRNFAREEFRCRCCDLADPHPLLVIGLQRLRDILRQPVLITSGSRCQDRNARVGGSLGSWHMPRPDMDGYTCAADIVVPGATLRDLMEVAEVGQAFGGGGIGVYVDGTPRLHVDVRHATGHHGAARWAMIDGQPADIEVALAEDEARRTTT